MPSAPTTQEPPKEGAKFRCSRCGMEIQVTKACTCEQNMSEFRCCGEPMDQTE